VFRLSLWKPGQNRERVLQSMSTPDYDDIVAAVETMGMAPE